MNEEEYFYKTVDKDMKTTNGYEYKLGTNELDNDDDLNLSYNGLHLYKNLDNLTYGGFYPRIFKAKPIGECIDDVLMVCCRKVELIEEIDPVEVNDNKWLYLYCRDVDDKEEIWKKLDDDKWIYKYCEDIKDREELWRRLTDNQWIYKYCKSVNDRKYLWQKLTEDRWLYNYCVYNKDRKELSERIENEYWKYSYEMDVETFQN